MSTPPGIPTQKKGMSCFAIGGIGCLVIIVALFLGGGAVLAKYFPKWKEAIAEYQKDAKSSPDKAAAKLGIKMLPNVVIIREDDAAKTITFKAGEGEELTMHYEGLSDGKKQPRMTNSKGEEVNPSGAPAEAAPAPVEAAPVPAPAPAPPSN